MTAADATTAWQPQTQADRQRGSGDKAWSGAMGVTGVKVAAAGASLPSPAHLSLPAHHLSIVVPMYNEVDNAAALIDAVRTALAAYPQPWELIVVDDGSRDATAAALRRHARATGAPVRVISLARNFRQTAAMQAGIDAARGEVIATLDGDLQNDPADIPRLVGRLLEEDIDLVVGWRRDRQDNVWSRTIPSRIANRLIRRVRDFADVHGNGKITGDIVRLTCERLEVDERGLDLMDRRLLLVLIEHYDGGPVGVETLAAALAEPRDTVEDVYEPYLLQQGFLGRTPRGRVATRLAYEHLGRPLPDKRGGTQGSLF